MKARAVLVLIVGGGLAAWAWIDWHTGLSKAPSRSVSIVLDGTPQTLDPVLMNEVTSAAIGNACHAPLIRLGDNGAILPEIAESVVVAPDAMEATISIRPHTTFWDGSEVTAADVAWSLLRLRDSQSVLKLTLERVVECVEVDPKTVKVRFTKPEPEFLPMIAHLQASIVKKNSDALPAKPLASQIIGAGAFRPDKFSQGAQYSFNANLGFYSPTNIEKLSFIVKTDPQAQISACRSGEAQVMRLKGPALREAVDANTLDAAKPTSKILAFEVARHKANEINVLLINWEAAQLKDASLSERAATMKALSNGLDRKALASALGGAEPAYSVIPVAALNAGYPSTIPRQGTSPIIPTHVEMLCSTDAMNRELASVAQPYLRAAGMETSLRQVDMARLVEMILARQHQMSVIAFEMPVVGVSPWLLFFKEGPFAAFGEPIEQVVDQASNVRSIINDQDRMAGWAEVAKKLDSTQTAWLPLVSRSTYVMHHRSVAGVMIDAAGTPYWTHLRLAEVHE